MLHVTFSSPFNEFENIIIYFTSILNNPNTLKIRRALQISCSSFLGPPDVFGTFGMGL